MAGPIRIAILANAAKARAEIDSVADRSSKLGSSLKQGIGVAAVGAGAALAAMAFKGIEGARESAQIHRVLASQIKGMGAEAKKAFGSATSFAEDYGKAIGKDDDDILKVVNKLSTFPAAFGKGTLGAEGMRRATKAAFDLEAAGVGSAEGNIIGLGKAMDNPIKGLTALSKSGVSFTDQQKKQITNYTKHGQLAKAQAVLLKGIESNAKNAATVQADGLDRAKVALDGLAEGIATKALPYLDKFGAWFTDVGIPKVEEFATWFGANVAPKIGEAFAVAKTAVSGFITVLSNPAFQAFAGSVLTIVAGLKIYSTTMAVIRGVTAAWTAAQAALNVVLALNPIGLVVLAIAALVAGLVIAYKRSETFRNIVNAVGGAMLAAGQKVVAFVKNAIARISELPGKIKAALSNAKSLLLGLGGDVVQGFINGIKNKVGDAARAAADMASSAYNAAKQALLSHSPSKKFIALGTFSGQGFSIGMARTVPAVKAAARKLATQALAATKAKLANQKQAIADLLKSRADYAKTVTDATRGGGITSLANLENVPKGSQAGTIVESYRAKLAAVRDFTSGINRLGRQGLGRGILSQLVEGGPEQAGGIVSALRGAGPAVLREINALDARIARESATFGAGFAGASFNGRIAAASAPPLVLEFRPSGDPLMDALLTELRKTIRVKGGNVQKVLGVVR